MKEKKKAMWDPLSGCHPVCESLVRLRSIYQARNGMIYTWEQMDQAIGLSLCALYPADAGRRPLWRVRCEEHSGSPAETFALSEYEKIYKYLQNRIEKLESSGLGFSKLKKAVTDVHVSVVVNVIIDGVKSQRVLKYE